MTEIISIENPEVIEGLVDKEAIELVPADLKKSI